MAGEQDIVLIYYEDNPLSFARIEDISPDIKPDWYHVKLLMLQLPIRVATWLLRDIYIDGAEFTMDGKRMRMEKVECPPDAEENHNPDTPMTAPGKSGKLAHAKVISLSDLKKK